MQVAWVPSPVGEEDPACHAVQPKIKKEIKKLKKNRKSGSGGEKLALG